MVNKLSEVESRIENALSNDATSLNLSNLGLDDLPPSVQRLSSLQRLELRENSLTTLPDWIADLKQLVLLDVSRNRLLDLPEALNKLTRLQSLKASSVHLKAPPEWISNLTQLKHLDLSRSHLTDLPEALGELKRLQLLNVSANQLSRVPKSIGRLNRLEELLLFGNSLEKLPDSLGQCARLRCLSLSNNQLASLPASLAALTELQELHLAANALSEFPESLTGLSKLRVLTLGHNDIETLPESMGRLRNLECLDLTSEGDVVAYWSPETWTVYNGLERRSKLRALPESLAQLNIRELYLHGNPRLKLPPEVLGAPWYHVINERRRPENAQKILEYYFRLGGGKRPLNEGKLILLGRGEVGKTCLVNRLVYDKFARTSMTCGIAITHWSVPIGKETVRLHVWDFGGQEIQHATHQFFLTERSLYVVVLNGRAGDEENDAEYWLKFVKTFGASSPTIVVLNKIKVQPFQMNRKALQDKYPFIRAFVETDCKPQTNNGRKQLLQEIQSAISSMANVRADFPAGWFQIKERLSKMRKPSFRLRSIGKFVRNLVKSIRLLRKSWRAFWMISASP